MKLSLLVGAFLEKERQECQLLDRGNVEALAVAALRFYCGWGHFNAEEARAKQLDETASQSVPTKGAADPTFATIYTNGVPQQGLIDPALAQPLPVVGMGAIGLDAELTESDWALVRPLFILYCEREQALMLESSRVMGVDVFGRSTAEVQGDIVAYENDLPRKAFIQPAFTV